MGIDAPIDQQLVAAPSARDARALPLEDACVSSRSCCLLLFFYSSLCMAGSPSLPHAAATRRASGEVLWRKALLRVASPRVAAQDACRRACCSSVLCREQLCFFFPRAQLDGAWMQLVFWSTDKIACMPSCAAAFV